ncbi:hypothetical protein [Methanosalsum natronophilum]|uniref:hypothetical protein n=1 Tax=Methanosalsum natronophilum TaxID=768733 RepID=UPI0021686B4C|nr:hypothetical protein [Methanosalsum natronophilum]MCS3924112.1 hypothetical protein [Methanosalsum natronophilum]
MVNLSNKQKRKQSLDIVLKYVPSFEEGPLGFTDIYKRIIKYETKKMSKTTLHNALQSLIHLDHVLSLPQTEGGRGRKGFVYARSSSLKSKERYLAFWKKGVNDIDSKKSSQRRNTEIAFLLSGAVHTDILKPLISELVRYTNYKGNKEESKKRLHTYLELGLLPYIEMLAKYLEDIPITPESEKKFWQHWNSFPEYMNEVLNPEALTPNALKEYEDWWEEEQRIFELSEKDYPDTPEESIEDWDIS